MKITRWNSTNPLGDLYERVRIAEKYEKRHETALVIWGNHQLGSPDYRTLRHAYANAERRTIALWKAYRRMEKAY